MRKVQKVIDKTTVGISAIMCAVMMGILFLNIVLRYTPGVGGVKWYMESTQYLNVWSMLIVGIAISVRNEHLGVNILNDHTHGIVNKIVKVICCIFIVLFYIGLAYGTFLLASKSKQDISTMPQFKMAYVYWVIPVVSVLSAISAIIGTWLEITDSKDKEGKDDQSVKGGVQV